MRKVLVAAAVIVLASSAAYAAYAAPPSGTDSASNPAMTCKKERASLGVDPFAKKYGTTHNLKNAFGKCVSGKSKGKDDAKDDDDKAEAKDKDKSEANDDDKSEGKAAKECKQARADMGAAAFGDKYGTNHNKANAFGKCVSSKSKTSGDDD